MGGASRKVPTEGPREPAGQEPACSDALSLRVESVAPREKSPVFLLEEALGRSSSRSALEAFGLVGRMFHELDERRGGNKVSLVDLDRAFVENRGKVWQSGSHLHIPRVNGSMFVVTDLEGHKPLIEAIFRRHDLLSRMLRGDPHDQVHLCVLGDTIDRHGWRATEILEFLYELKLEHGLWDNIHILSGNHELNPDKIQRKPNKGGFYFEVVSQRSSYRELGDERGLLAKGLMAWRKEHFEADDEHHPLRVALWRAYNEAFKASPLTITTENGLYLTHAGITDKGAFEVLSQSVPNGQPSCIEAFKCLADAWCDPEIIKDLSWSDFSTSDKYISFNERGRDPLGKVVPGPGLAFGIESTREFLGFLDKRLVIRGHQPEPPKDVTQLGSGTWSYGDAVVTTNTGEGREYLEIGLQKDIDGVGDVVVHHVENRISQ